MRDTTTPALTERAIAALLIVLVALLGCPPQRRKLSPAAGLPEFQEPGMIEVPGARVNPLGGNLLVRRTDLSIDTHLGTREIGATYNSASGEWLWSFEVRYDGAHFTDAVGTLHDVSALAAGEAIPGTHWVVVDADTVKTKGGLAHEFDADARLRAIHYTSAEYPRLVYRSEQPAGATRIVAIDQCTAPGECDPVFAIDYADNGRVASIIDRAGRRVEVTYEGALPVQVRDGLDTARGGPGTRYEYDGSDLTAVVNSEGERVEYAYAGRRLQEVRSIGEEHPLHRFDYYAKNDAGLYATRYLDPLGHATWFRYDAERRLHEREAEAVGERLLLSWRGRRVVERIEPGGVTTRWTHDGDDVSSETQPSGNVVHFRYAREAVNRERVLERPLREVVDSVGLVERRSYDAVGRLTAIENGEGERVAGYTYAADESVAFVTTPERVVGYAAYGAHGHPTEVSVGEASVTIHYDAVGNRLRGPNDMTPELGGVVDREYDEDRNLRRIVVADAGYAGFPAEPEQSIEIGYRSDGRRTRITRPGGGDHEFAYDGLGRLVEVRERVDGTWRSTRWEYDAAGRCVARALTNGMRSEIDYDAAGHVSAVRHLRDGRLETSAVLRYANGRLESIEDPSRNGLERYQYDAAGRVETIAYPDGEVLTRGYDLRSRNTREVFASGSLQRWFDRSYDLANRVKSLSDSGMPLLVHDYAAGRRVETRHGNGLVRRYSYDASNGHLVASSTENPGGVVEETTIRWENEGGFAPGMHVTAETTTLAGVVATTREEYRLGPGVDATGHEPAIGKRVYLWSDGVDLRAYEYDALGNALGSAALGEHFEYNAERNRLLSATTNAAGTITYSYDEAGFVTSRRGVPLTWTASGRLASLGSDVTLTWDALDRRIHSLVMGLESRWLFGGRVQADAAGTPVAIDLGEVRVDLVGSGQRYRHLDFRGNVKFVSDEAGQVRSHYHYDAYGLSQTLGSEEDPVRFVARSQIGELMLLGARAYDPAVGRFLSPDPVLQHVNQYAYTLGNPVWFADPFGRDAEAVIGGIVTTGGFVLSTLALFTVATPAAALLAGTAFGLAALGFALWVARVLHDAVGVMEFEPPFPPEDGGYRPLGEFSPPTHSCSPVRLVSIPGSGSLHWLLIGLQLLLAPLLIRSRVARKRRTGP